MILVLLGCTSPACPDGEVREEGACVPYEADEPVVAQVWSPTPQTTWQWQLTGALDASADVEMFDLDLLATSDSDLAPFSDDVLICYFSAGSWEDWREDADLFPEEALGQELDGWPDERWLDINHPQVLEVLEERLDRAVERGCDGVEPDNVDGYANRNGVGLNATEQLRFNRWLADQAHERGLSVGLKNDLDQIEDLEPWFDWALNEECHAYDECGRLQAFLDADKAVFHVEYVDDLADSQDLAAQVCPERPADFSTLIKGWDLGPEFLPCE